MINYAIYGWNEKRKCYIQLFKGKDKPSIIIKFNNYHKNLVNNINKSWGHGNGVSPIIQAKYHQITNEAYKPYIMNLITKQKEDLIITI